jgi:hypothetical protein
MTKIAIIGPSFFSYVQAIRNEFQKRGVFCQSYDERHSNSILAKIVYRLDLTWLIAKKRVQHLNRIIQDISGQKFTDVLLVDVEVVDKEFVKTLHGLGIRVHVYMWDSAKNKKRFTSYLAETSSRGSFDFHDCKTLGMTYIPLFAEDLFRFHSRNDIRDIDISFCGTLHSDRSYHLKKLKKVAKKRRLKLELLTFFHSKALFAMKSLHNFSNVNFIRSISTKGFPKKVVAGSMRRSQYVFDIQHKGQGGLTARTFEALRSGAGLITFNKNVRSLPQIYQDRIHVIDDVSDIEKLTLTPSKPTWEPNSEPDYFLSLERFVDDLSAMMAIETDLSKNALSEAGGHQ